MIFEKDTVVLLLKGRYAGKKAVVVGEIHEDSGRQCVMIAGISKAPSQVSENMTDAQRKRRSDMGVFVKKMNIRHLMATRHKVESFFRKVSLPAEYTDIAQRRAAEKEVKKELQRIYTVNAQHWMFKKIPV